MSFDDQLKRTFETLNERIRTEIDRQVQTVADELAAAARTEREQAVVEARQGVTNEATSRLELAVSAARQDAHNEGLAVGRIAGHQGGLEAGREAGLEAGRQIGLEEGRNAGLEEGRKAGLEEGRTAGLEEGRTAGLEEGRTAGLEEGRKAGIEEGRRAGFEEGRSAGLDAGLSAGLEEGRVQGILEGRAQAEQDRPKTTATGGAEQLADSVRAIGRARSLTGILDALVECAAKEAARAGVWLVRGPSLRHWRSTGFDLPVAEVPLKASTALAEAARSNAAVSDAGGFAVPIAMNGDVVAVLYAANPDSQRPNPDAIDVLTRYAARCLEALTAFKAARALTERPGAAPVEANDAARDVNDEEHVSARRYARLLVSEIKLYHEAAVVEGRRDRDLASRLGGEIARARMLYEERVPPEVRQRAEYFHDELVRTLADGDATLLQLT